MEFGIVIRIVGVDADDGMLTAAVDVASRGFRGVSEVYTTADALKDLSSRLELFPEGPTKSLEFQFGIPGGYGYLGLAFSVLDATGRCACQVRLESNYLPAYGHGSKNRIDVDMGVEPNAIDRFVSDLQNLLNSETGEAVLEGIEKF
ncbi:hypothetical protein AB4Z32_26765 [Massilia sp. 2TAF26]|uniref:hypothetical protein n=1 Tax=Massilia sp. 2TAF26 TaxID=3233012 RepID=UPI003F99E9AB